MEPSPLQGAAALKTAGTADKVGTPDVALTSLNAGTTVALQ